MQSFFRNWHKPSAWYRATKNNLCNTWWPKAEKEKFGGVKLTFTQMDSNKQISFTLSDEHAAHIHKQLTEILTNQ